MRDFIHLYEEEPQRENISVWQQGLVAVVFVGLVAAICWCFVEAATKEADIADAVAAARRKERERIYTANQDILQGHQDYIKQIDALLEREYRREAK